MGQGCKQNDGATGTLGTLLEAPENSCGEVDDLGHTPSYTFCLWSNRVFQGTIHLGTPRYTWGNGAHGMLRVADVAVMLLWCLWPMRVVLPAGLLQVDKLRWSAAGSETKRLGSETRLRKLRTRVSET